jgi:hypothetical protein
MNKIKLTIVLMTTILLLTACDDKESGKLENRVLDFWNLKIEKDFKTAYQFLSPGWKSTESELSYASRMSMSRANWLNVHIKSKKCSQTDLCEVNVEIEYEFRFRGVGGKDMIVKTDLTENWIMKNNIWYHVPIDRKLQ